MPGNQDTRTVTRSGPFEADLQTQELRGTRLSARISELGVGGRYFDALTPFPEGMLVKLQILKVVKGIYLDLGHVLLLLQHGKATVQGLLKYTGLAGGG
jgi:hypothetical protein